VSIPFVAVCPVGVFDTKTQVTPPSPENVTTCSFETTLLLVKQGVRSKEQVVTPLDHLPSFEMVGGGQRFAQKTAHKPPCNVVKVSMVAVAGRIE
jgi:hypothetical protein